MSNTLHWDITLFKLPEFEVQTCVACRYIINGIFKWEYVFTCVIFERNTSRRNRLNEVLSYCWCLQKVYTCFQLIYRTELFSGTPISTLISNKYICITASAVVDSIAPLAFKFSQWESLLLVVSSEELPFQEGTQSLKLGTVLELRHRHFGYF